MVLSGTIDRPSNTDNPRPAASRLLPWLAPRRHSYRILQGDTHATATRLLHKHRIQLHRMVDRDRSIHLAGTAPPAAGRSVATSARPAQFPLRGIGFPGAWRRVRRSARRL